MIVAINAEHGLHTQGKEVPWYIDKETPKEWTLNDRVARELMNYLIKNEYEVEVLYDLDGEVDVPLGTRARVCNSTNADVCITIGHNAGIHGGIGGGTVVYHYDSPERAAQGKKLYDSIIAETQYINNRAVPVQANSKLFMLRRTVCPSFLVECAFMDSVRDYQKIIDPEFVKAVASGIGQFIISEFPVTSDSEFMKANRCNCKNCKCRMCERD